MASEPSKKKRTRIKRLWMLLPLIAAFGLLAVPAEWWFRLTPKGRWAHRYDMGCALIRSKEYAEAEEYLEQALEIAEEIFHPSHYCTCNTLYNLGVAYYEQEELIDSEKMFQRHVAMAAEVWSPGDQYVVLGLRYLAEIYYSQDRIDQSISVSKRILSIQEEVFGPDDVAVSRALYDIGADYVILDPPNHYVEAESYLLRCLRIRERALEPGDPALEATRDWLRTLYINQNTYEDARTLKNETH